MSEEKGGIGMYLRLQIAYALEFAIWGAWSYAVGTYCAAHGLKQGYLYSAFALGALFAPLVGPIADKKFAAQKVLAFMQLICGLALGACHVISHKAAEAGATTNIWLVLMFVAGLMFMPSIPLINSVVFKHIPDKNKAPFVFIFGTIGWIVVNLVISALKDWGLENFYLIDAACALLLAVYALTLPNTPPAGASDSSDPFGFRAFGLFLKPSFFIFVVCATIVGVFGSNYYFAFVGQCFPDKGVLNQFSEIFFMAALAFAAGKWGLKAVLSIGMLAWGVRYFCFASGNDGLALVGILCHGAAYAFLYTAAYMYGDKVAPKEMKASVQALLAFLLLGVAQVASGYFANNLSSKYERAAAETAPAVQEQNDADAEQTIEAEAADQAFFSFSSVAYAQDAPIEAAEAAQEEAAEATLELAEDVKEAVANPAEAVEEVKEAAAETVEEAKEAVSDAADAAADAVEDAKEAAADVAEKAADAASEAVEEVKEAAADAVEDAKEAVSDAVEDAKEAVSDAVDAVTDLISGDEDEAEEAVEGAAEETAEEAAAPATKRSLTEVWDKAQWEKYDWKKIWGIPGCVCMIFGVIFLLLGREPKAADDEEEAKS